MQKKQAKKATKKKKLNYLVTAADRRARAKKTAATKKKKAATKEINVDTIAVSAEVLPPSKLELEEFTIEDHIIGNISLPPTTKIKIEITLRSVSLYVGPRDWQWERETGVLIGAGTELAALETDQVEETIKEIVNEETVESSSTKEN